MPQPTIPETRRILLEASCLARDESLTVRRLARRMGVSPKVVRRDLQLLTLTGIPPYSPLELVEVDEDPRSGALAMRQAGKLGRSIHLTCEEVEALAFAVGVLGRAGRPAMRIRTSDAESRRTGERIGHSYGRSHGRRRGKDRSGTAARAFRTPGASSFSPGDGVAIIHVRNEENPASAMALFQHDPAVESVQVTGTRVGRPSKGGVLLELGCADWKRLEALLVAMGGKVVALSPPEFVEGVRRLARETVARWSSSIHGPDIHGPTAIKAPARPSRPREQGDTGP